MIKLLLLGIAIAVVFGVITYEDDKVVIDTEQGKELIQKSKEFIDEKVEVK